MNIADLPRRQSHSSSSNVWTETNLPTTSELRDLENQSKPSHLKVSETNEITAIFSNTIRLYNRVGDDTNEKAFTVNEKPFNRLTLKFRIANLMKTFSDSIKKEGSGQYFNKLLGPYHNQRVILGEVFHIVEAFQTADFSKIGTYNLAQENVEKLMKECQKNFDDMVAVIPEDAPPVLRRNSSSRRSRNSENRISQELAAAAEAKITLSEFELP